MIGATHALCCDGRGGGRRMRSRATACSDDEPDAVTLVVYDSFPTADTSINAALDEFTADTGIDVEMSSPATPARWCRRRHSPRAIRRGT